MKVLVVTLDPDTLQIIDGCLNGAKGRRVEMEILHIGYDRAAISAMLEKQRPELLIMESAAESYELAEIDAWASRYHEMAIVLLGSDTSPEYLLKAMQSGVRELLALPLDPAALDAALQRIWRRMDPLQRAGQQARLLAFLPCKGGSGATFLATNLAYILADSLGQRVALLDFNLQYGDAALFVSDQRPQSSLADVAREIGRLDPEFLASSMVHVLPGFDLLAAPEDPEKSLDVQPSNVDSLLAVARSAYDIVIVDMARSLNPVTLRVLDEAEIIYPVLQQTLPFIRDASRMFATFRTLGYKPEKLHPLVNRYEKGGRISLGDVERTLGVRIGHTIPNSFLAVADSVNQGIPIARLDSRNPVSKALLEMAQELVHGRRQEAATGGWLQRLLHSSD